MANTSIILSNLDFDTHKNTLIQYLKSQEKFRDYDFDGSNINVILDILSYNTFHNAFYLNMIGNEMFLDTAKLRDSVVSHAKELNYTPSSFTSAASNVDITILSNDTTKRSITIPKGTTFTSKYATRSFTFTTGENIVLTSFNVNSNSTITFTGTNIQLYEGFYVNDTFTYNSNNIERFLLTNKNIDTSSISATVIEDVGATTLTYNRATSLFDLDGTSRVFFIQGAENEQYEIMFGDGVNGRQPKDNSIISVEYRICNGELPNGARTFVADSSIDGETNITVSTNSPAAGGSVSESIDSIKFNAPRHFTTQERAVTAEDYENLLKLNFPEINTVSAYGGEDLNPPRFGKVFVAVDLTDVDGLPEAKRDEYYRFLKPRSPVSIDPIFVDPEYTYIYLDVNVNYNLNTTRLTADDIRTLVLDAITSYSSTNLNNFNRVFRYSTVVNAIDDAHVSIISNETNIRVVKILTPTLNTSITTTVDFQIPLDTTLSVAGGGYTLTSTRFTYDRKNAVLQDDGNGRMQVVSVADGTVITEIGTIDYSQGLITLSNLVIEGYEGNGIKLYARPRNRDVQTVNNVILNIVDDDIDLTVTAIRQ